MIKAICNAKSITPVHTQLATHPVYSKYTLSMIKKINK